MGLYLFSDGFKRKLDEKSLVELNEYGSVECGSNLILNADLTFKVVFDIWDAELGDYREITVNGSWQAKKQEISYLILKAGTQRYSLKKE